MRTVQIQFFRCSVWGARSPTSGHVYERTIGETLVSEGVEVFHLDLSGDPFTQAQVMSENAPVQTSLF